MDHNLRVRGSDTNPPGINNHFFLETSALVNDQFFLYFPFRFQRVKNVIDLVHLFSTRQQRLLTSCRLVLGPDALKSSAPSQQKEIKRVWRSHSLIISPGQEGTHIRSTRIPLARACHVEIHGCKTGWKM